MRIGYGEDSLEKIMEDLQDDLLEDSFEQLAVAATKLRKIIQKKMEPLQYTDEDLSEEEVRFVLRRTREGVEALLKGNNTVEEQAAFSLLLLAIEE